MNKSADTSVLLGICTGKKLLDKDNDNPRVTKIGGVPAFFTQTSNSNINKPLLCELCGLGDYMRLICQVYSPTEHVERSLYLFACTSPQQCSLQSKGWKVFRNQTVFNISENTVINSNSIKLANVKEETTSIWSFLKNDGDKDQNDVDFDDFTELEALVDGLNSTRKSNKAIKHSGTNTDTLIEKASKKTRQQTTIEVKLCQSYWPAWQVGEEYDEEEFSVVLSKSLQSKNTYAMEDMLASSSMNQDVISDDRVQAMYAAYLQDEEDAALVSKLPTRFNTNDMCQDNTFLEDTDTHLNNSSSIEEHNKQLSTEPGVDDNFDDNHTDNLHELLFQHKCNLQPRQVLRYAYDGLPLWCTSPPPAESQCIPVCSLCGTQRVFEMQLMPALLSLPLPLPAVNTTATSSSDSHSAPVTAARTRYININTGFDFGVVTVWSCPRSCSPVADNSDNNNSRGLYAEYVIVQPSADLVHTQTRTQQPS